MPLSLHFNTTLNLHVRLNVITYTSMSQCHLCFRYEQEAEDVVRVSLNDGKEDVAIPSLDHEEFGYSNPDSVDEQKLFEEDIMLTSEQWEALRERKAIRDLVYRWPNGSDDYPLVPYYIASGVNAAAVRAGLQHWMDNTCIKFTPVSNNTNQPYLRYYYGSGCWSNVGYQRIIGQNISIGRNCDKLGTVVHETGHAIGFFHEQSRPDRDNYVKIIFSNIASNNTFNFLKRNTTQINDYDVLYDYSSVMHYGCLYRSMNGNLTISTVDPFAQTIIGQRTGLSHRDKLLANRMYNCTGKWLAKCGLTVDPCQNEGYIGVNCTCVCPAGTSGARCQTLISGYYSQLISNCSARITRPGVITSPNFPKKYPAKSRCIYVIKAPTCYIPKLTFKNFSMSGYENRCDTGVCCKVDFLEIRTTSLTNGNLYCNTDIKSGQVFTSSQNTMILFFFTTSNNFTGFSANVSFTPISGCK
ncbi:protein SpAN-like [Cherax quadricarinatus]|uniref:protein SpAN-like n=1 Tax=Cherax quadricarinatus TaxID=27406 RepID=UPI00387E90FB